MAKTNNIPTRIFVHTTAADYNVIRDQFFAVNRWHQERFGSDCRSSLGYYGGYHTIATNGKEYRYREDLETSCAAVGYNNTALHHAIGFDGDKQFPLPADIEITRKRLKKWVDKYNIPVDNIHILPHRAVAPHKTCYGSLLHDDWAYRLLEEVKKDPDTQAKKDHIEKNRQILKDKIKELQLQLIILLGKYIKSVNKRPLKVNKK